VPFQQVGQQGNPGGCRNVRQANDPVVGRAKQIHQCAIRGWRGENAAWRVALRRRLSPSMVGKIDMNALWRDAVEVACARLSDWDGGKAVQAKAKLDGLPCPFDLPGLIAETADVPAVLAKLPG
jgi:hypothetical protein